MTTHGPWTILKRREIHRDPWIQVIQDDVIRPDGKAGTHDAVYLLPGVTVLAVDENQNAHLTEEFRYAVGRVTLEGVSGGRHEGESPLATAQRELREELGILAAAWTDLGQVDPFTSVIASPTQLFLARGLAFVPQAPEGTELIRHVTVSFAEALAMTMDGRITHAPTCVAILKAARLLGQVALQRAAHSIDNG